LASSWIARTDTADNLSISSNISTSHINLYPNPVSDILRVKISFGNINHINIYGINGKLYRKYNINHGSVELDLSSFESGVYVIKIQTASELFVRKIIIN